jgi:hypothetical protein
MGSRSERKRRAWVGKMKGRGWGTEGGEWRQKKRAGSGSRGKKKHRSPPGPHI